MWCTYNSFQRRWIFVRNHYDLSRRRADPARRASEETKAEGGIGGRRFPWLTCAFIFSLLLGTGTAVYAISAFSSPPPVPKSGAALTNGTDDPVDGAGDEAAGFPISEDEGDTPPVWEDAPDPPAPSGPADTADAQKPKRRRPPDTLSSGQKMRKRSAVGNLSSDGGFPPRRDLEASQPPSPPDSSASGDEGSKAPLFDPPPVRVAVGYPFWMASQAGGSSSEAIPGEINLFGYQLLADGTVNTATESGQREDVRAIRSARRSGAPLVPIVAVNDPDFSQGMLTSQKQRSRTADRLMRWAAERNFDGMDILLGSIAPSEREHLTPFFEELAEKLHRENKRLGLHVLHAAAVTRTEWKRWGQAVDRLKIHPYLPGERQPEDNASLEPIDQLLRLVPREKVIFVFPVQGKNESIRQPDPKGHAAVIPDHEKTKAVISHLAERHPDIDIQLWLLEGVETLNYPAERAQSD